MPLQFDPPLQAKVVIPIDPSRGQQTILKLHATFGADQISLLGQHKATVQVWSNLPSADTNPREWHAISFEHQQKIEQEGRMPGPSLTGNTVAISLASSKSTQNSSISAGNPGHDADTPTTLQATLPLPAEKIALGTPFEYTYRVLYPDGGIDWRGNGNSNGTIVFTEKEKSVRFGKLDWNEDPSGFKSCILEGSMENILDLNMDYQWSGWGISENGISTFELPSDAPGPSTLLFLTCSNPATPYLDLGEESQESFIIQIAMATSLVLSPQGVVSVKRGDMDDETRLELEIYPATAILELFKLMSHTGDGNRFPVTLSWSVLSHSSDNFLALFSPPDRLTRTVQLLPLQPSSQITIETLILKPKDLLEGMGKCAAIYDDGNQEVKLVDAGKEAVAVEVGGKGGTFKICPCYDLSVGGEEWIVAPLEGKLDAPPPKAAIEQAVQAVHDDPALIIPEANANANGKAVSSASNATAIQTSHPFLASAAYIALILTILLSYIAPATSSKYRRQLTEAIQAERTTEEPESVVEKKRPAPPSETGILAFDILEPGGSATLLLQRPLEEASISGIQFKCGDQILPATSRTVGKGRWTVELKNLNGSKLEIRSAS